MTNPGQTCIAGCLLALPFWAGFALLLIFWLR